MASIIEQILLDLDRLLPLALDANPVVGVQSYLHEVGAVVGRPRVADSHFVLVSIAVRSALAEFGERHSILEEHLFGEVFGQLDFEDFVLGQSVQEVVVHEQPLRQNLLNHHFAAVRLDSRLVLHSQFQGHVDRLFGPLPRQLAQRDRFLARPAREPALDLIVLHLRGPADWLTVVDT